MPRHRVASNSKVFVVGPYITHGGMFSVYHVARILNLDFGLPVFAVTMGAETLHESFFNYEPIFDSIAKEQLGGAFGENDILLANAVFSNQHFGLRLPGFKVMYVGHFNTFKILDCNFQHYVSNSGFVQSFVKSVYGITTRVIPPFVQTQDAPAPPAWEARPVDSLAIVSKQKSTIELLILDRLRRAVASRCPQIDLDRIMAPAPHRQFLEQMGSVRHVLTLAVAEGFGKIPLEAMGMGSTVIGFDGYGGREYMRKGVNCEVVEYPNIDGLAEALVTVVTNPAYAATLARAGQATAAAYNYDRFRAAWRREFSELLD